MNLLFFTGAGIVSNSNMMPTAPGAGLMNQSNASAMMQASGMGNQNATPATANATMLNQAMNSGQLSALQQMKTNQPGGNSAMFGNAQVQQQQQHFNPAMNKAIPGGVPGTSNSAVAGGNAFVNQSMAAQHGQHQGQSNMILNAQRQEFIVQQRQLQQQQQQHQSQANFIPNVTMVGPTQANR